MNTQPETRDQNETPAQIKAIEALTRKGFYITGSHGPDDRGEFVVFMTKSVRFGRRYGEVDQAGLVNGQSVEAFLRSI